MGAYSKLYYIRNDKITFEVRHDDMLGNYIYTDNKEYSEYLTRLAQKVISKIMLMLEGDNE